jgi:hypothetical protein
MIKLHLYIQKVPIGRLMKVPHTFICIESIRLRQRKVSKVNSTIGTGTGAGLLLHHDMNFIYWRGSTLSNYVVPWKVLCRDVSRMVSLFQ